MLSGLVAADSYACWCAAIGIRSGLSDQTQRKEFTNPL